MGRWIAFLAAMLACHTAAANEWGPKPDQARAQEMALAVMSTILKDPGSATYEWREIVGTSSWTTTGAPCYGWVLRASVNAKNSYGGYVGAEDYVFLVNEDRVACVIGKRRFRHSMIDERVY